LGFLIESAGIPIDKVDSHIRGLPIHAACEGGHSDIVSYLIKKGSNLQNTDSSGRSPLVFAVMVGSLSSAKLLIVHGVPLNVTGRKFSPVIAAATFGHLDIVDCLIRAGGSVELANCYVVTPLEAAWFISQMSVLSPRMVFR
jgi:ankyrin repeat protein